MEIPEEIVIVGAAYATDGGSIHLAVRFPRGDSHSVILWQHVFLEAPDPKRLPGRLYVDGRLVPVRSPAERRLLLALRRERLELPAAPGPPPPRPAMIVGADLEAYRDRVEEGPAQATRHLVRQLLEFVESEAYVELAEHLGG